MRQDRAGAYQNMQKAGLSDREAEAMALMKAAAMLKHCQTNWSAPDRDAQLDKAAVAFDHAPDAGKGARQLPPDQRIDRKVARNGAGNRFAGSTDQRRLRDIASQVIDLLHGPRPPWPVVDPRPRSKYSKLQHMCGNKEQLCLTNYNADRPVPGSAFRRKS